MNGLINVQEILHRRNVAGPSVHLNESIFLMRSLIYDGYIKFEQVFAALQIFGCCVCVVLCFFFLLSSSPAYRTNDGISNNSNHG